MPALYPRQKAERISAIFRARQPIDILPAELIPADLDEAYQVRAAYEAIESAAGRGTAPATRLSHLGGGQSALQQIDVAHRLSSSSL
jgi:hypothetical protein